LAIAALIYLVISSLRDAGHYALTIPELVAQGAYAIDQPVRVSGTLDGTSIVWDAQSLSLSFVLQGGGETLPVSYHGARPNNFHDGAEVIVEGRLGPDGVLHAQTLLLKCPSRYVAGSPVAGSSGSGD
jgi:cytochrome c-type biogenesis protein CcmE